MGSPGRITPLLCVGLLVATGPALAQSGSARGTHGFEIKGFAGVLFPQEPDFVSGETSFAYERDQEIYFGGRLGYTFPIGLFVQGEVAYSPLTIIEPTRGRNINMFFYGGSVGYNLQVTRSAQVFVLGGGGLVQFDPDDLGTENEARVHFGGGARLFLTPNVAVRVEVRDNLIPATLTETRRALNPGLSLEDELTHNLELTGGFSLVFGGPRDSDGDGVADGEDACPGTEPLASVDARGCALDGDGDGVGDHRDACPNTRAGAEVDVSGCALDGDADGVPNGLDRCPNTPAGARVDSDGCVSDGDRDGVPDGLDRCPNTPSGAVVNESGCAQDSDADGVPDGLDQCPNTPANRDVNGAGCSRIEQALEEGRLVLHNVYFDFNRATLRDESRPVLTEVAQALAERPNLRIEIQGHTDSVGSAAYNQQLSQRRAEAVLDFLMTFPRLSRSQFVVRGYGESRPIASNETDVGRQENRRVEFVVLSRGEQQ